MDVKVSTQRITANLEDLKAFTATPGNGCTRMPFTRETREAAEYLKKEMAAAGLAVTEDCVGNLIGVLPGEDSEAPAIVVGSHYDSVYNGGDYDGIAGVVLGIELARILQEEGKHLPVDFIVVAFMDEEGCRFGTGYFGSYSILGEMDVEQCRHFTDRDEISVYDAMKDYGLDPERVTEAAWPRGRIGHYIEAHIEQGPVLDAQKIELGLVNCIVGIQRYMFTVHGRSDHAGTTPMHMRKDAVDVASKVICHVADLAREEAGGTVATVGFIQAFPGGMNVVAQSAQFSVDIRSTKNETINKVADEIRALLDEETGKWGMTWTEDPKLTITPCDLSEPMLGVMEESCKEHGYSYLRMPSGAGHDALAIGQHYDTVMLFVPSKDGRSHCPEEYTDYESFGKAAEVLYDLITRL